MRIVKLSIALIISGFFAHANAADSVDLSKYTIKQSEPSVGTTIKRPIINAGTVPLDKRYADLSPQEKAILRSDFAQMKESDEPPFPAKGLMPILKELRKVHELLGLQYKGALAINVQIDSQGNPSNVSIIDSPAAEISEVTSVALLGQTYKPAICNGAPCAMEYHFRAELVGPKTDTLSPTSAQSTIPQSK